MSDMFDNLLVRGIDIIADKVDFKTVNRLPASWQQMNLIRNTPVLQIRILQ